jgi:hypothetical protein
VILGSTVSSLNAVRLEGLWWLTWFDADGKPFWGL